MIDPADVKLCLDSLDRQIGNVLRGEHSLKIPLLQDYMQRGQGRHFHFAPEFIIQVAGGDHFDFPRQQFALLANQICIIPTGIPHKEKPCGDRTAFHQIAIMLWEETRGAQAVSWHIKRNTSHLPPLQIIPTPEANRAIYYLSAASEIYHSRSPSHETEAQGLILAFFALVRDILQASPSDPGGEARRIMECRHEVQRRLADSQLSVQVLARHLGYSANYLSSLFRRQTGETLSRYIQRERLTQAQMLLKQSSMTIKEVACAVGIPQASYFTRVFRQFAGVCPRQYRGTVGLDAWPEPATGRRKG